MSLTFFGWSAAVSEGISAPDEAPFMRVIVVERAHFGGDEARRQRFLRYVRASANLRIERLSLVSLETGRKVTIEAPDRADKPVGDVAPAVDEVLDRGTEASPQLQLAFPTLAALLADHRDAAAQYARTACKRGGDACARYLSKIEVVAAGSTFHRDPNIDFRKAVPAEGCFANPSQAFRRLTHPDGIKARTWPAEGPMAGLKQDIRLILAAERGDASDVRPGVVRFFHRLANTLGYRWGGVIDLNEPEAAPRYAKLSDATTGGCELTAAGEPGAPPETLIAQQPAPKEPPPAQPSGPPSPSATPPASKEPPSIVSAPTPAQPPRAQQPAPPPPIPAVRPPSPPVTAKSPPPSAPNLDASLVPQLGEPVVSLEGRVPSGPPATPPRADASPPRAPASITPPIKPNGPDAGIPGDLSGSIAPPLRRDELSVTIRWSNSSQFDLVGRATLTDRRTGDSAPPGVATFAFAPTPRSRTERSATGRFAVGRSSGREFAVGFLVENGRCSNRTDRFATLELAAGRAVSIGLRVNGRTSDALGEKRLRLVCEKGRPRLGDDQFLVKVR